MKFGNCIVCQTHYGISCLMIFMSIQNVWGDCDRYVISVWERIVTASNYIVSAMALGLLMYLYVTTLVNDSYEVYLTDY